MGFNKKNIPGTIYLLLFICTGLIPNYGSLDRIATQWLYLSVLNTIGLIHFLFDTENKTRIKSYLQFKPFLFLIAFILWGMTSYLYSENQTEVIVKIVRWIQLPLSLFILMQFFHIYSKNYFKIISFFVLTVLLAELYFSFSTFFQLIKYAPYDFSFANLLKGASGNKNITAASILIKIPFIIYLISEVSNRLIKFTLASILFSSTYLIFLLSARASIIGLFLVLSILVINYIYFSIKNKTLIKDISFGLILTSMLASTILFSFNYRNNNTASFTNRVTTINTEDTSTQQRLRFYKHSFTQVINNPFIGVGLGNWKIKSIDYDKKDIMGYIVPYHTHNDFLEIAAELGVIGLILYLLIFIFPLISLIKNKTEEKLININSIILLLGVIYFIDANLNFPHARPIMQVPFILILALSYAVKQNNKIDNV